MADYNQDEILDLIDTIREDSQKAEELRDEIERLEDELRTANEQLKLIERQISDDRRQLDEKIDDVLNAPDTQRGALPSLTW